MDADTRRRCKDGRGPQRRRLGSAWVDRTLCQIFCGLPRGKRGWRLALQPPSLFPITGHYRSVNGPGKCQISDFSKILWASHVLIFPGRAPIMGQEQKSESFAGRGGEMRKQKLTDRKQIVRKESASQLSPGKEFIKRIKEWMKQLGWSARDLSAASRLSRQRVAACLGDSDRPVDKVDVNQLAVAFAVAFDSKRYDERAQVDPLLGTAFIDSLLNDLLKLAGFTAVSGLPAVDYWTVSREKLRRRSTM